MRSFCKVKIKYQIKILTDVYITAYYNSKLKTCYPAIIQQNL
jgi:hypothetical protein